MLNPNFLSLDTEGGELEMLSNFPFDKVKIDFLAIEHQPKTSMKFDPKTTGAFSKSLNEMVRLKYEAEDIEKQRNVVHYLEDQELVDLMLGKGYYLFDVFCVPDRLFLY